MAKTGELGGQCVHYARMTLKPASGIHGNANTWYNNAAYCTKLPAIQSQCAVCWAGGAQGYGHVGVVEVWNAEKHTMRYSDSNFKSDEKVIVRENLTETQLKTMMGHGFTFQGYVALN